MNAEQLIYDLAMIYAREQFHDTLKGLSENQKLPYYELADLLYRYFEDAYTALHLMPEKYFDFSDLKISN